VPARVAVYFVLALALFPGASYGRVWDTLAGALRQAGHLVASVTAAGLACVRRRVGPDPLRELFEVVAGPLGRPCTRGVSWRGLRTVAFDGCRSTRVPETGKTFLAIRHTMLKGRVLRSGDPQGLRQEMWALLTVHQLLRMAMLDATDAMPGCDPDRACFTAALVAARDSVTRGAAIVPDAGSELTGPITEAVTGALLPPRRSRISARTVKGVSARYGHRRSHEDRPCVSTPVTALDIIVHFPQRDTPVPAPTAAPPGCPGQNPAPQQDPPVTAQTLLPPAVPMHTSRLEDVLAAMGTAPEREWRAIELATLLRLDRGDLTGELIRWSRRQIAELLDKPE
jgi:hypothetical protein